MELVEIDVRTHGEGADRSPPDEARVRGYEGWQRKVLCGSELPFAHSPDC